MKHKATLYTFTAKPESHYSKRGSTGGHLLVSNKDLATTEEYFFWLLSTKEMDYKRNRVVIVIDGHDYLFEELKFHAQELGRFQAFLFRLQHKRKSKNIDRLVKNLTWLFTNDVIGVAGEGKW